MRLNSAHYRVFIYFVNNYLGGYLETYPPDPLPLVREGGV